MVSKELPCEVRYVVVTISGGSVEVLSTVDGLVDVGELDWERLVTVLDESWVLVELRVVGSAVTVTVTGGPVIVSVLDGVTVGLGDMLVNNSMIGVYGWPVSEPLYLGYTSVRSIIKCH
jgi:hypothetical protein